MNPDEFGQRRGPSLKNAMLDLGKKSGGKLGPRIGRASKSLMRESGGFVHSVPVGAFQLLILEQDEEIRRGHAEDDSELLIVEVPRELKRSEGRVQRFCMWNVGHKLH